MNNYEILKLHKKALAEAIERQQEVKRTLALEKEKAVTLGVAAECVEQAIESAVVEGVGDGGTEIERAGKIFLVDVRVTEL